MGRRVTTDEVTKKVTKDVPNTTDWQETASAAPEGYRVEVFGNPDVTGEKGLPQRVTDAAFNNALKNSEVVIYVGHGRGDPATVPFVQQGIQAGNTYYTPIGTTGAIQTAVVPEGTQVSATGPKPDTQAAVVVNLSCNADRNGGAYFSFTGSGQVMVTMNSNWNGVTSFDALDKAANAFVRTYINTGGNVQKAIDAANKVLQTIPGGNKQNVGDLIQNEQRDRALDLLNRAISFEPNNPSFYVARGSHVFWAPGNPRTAEADFRRAIELSKGTNASAWAGLGDSLARLGRRDEAIATYRHYLSIRAKSAAHYDGEIRKSIELLENNTSKP